MLKFYVAKHCLNPKPCLTIFKLSQYPISLLLALVTVEAQCREPISTQAPSQLHGKVAWEVTRVTWVMRHGQDVIAQQETRHSKVTAPMICVLRGVIRMRPFSSIYNKFWHPDLTLTSSQPFLVSAKTRMRCVALAFAAAVISRPSTCQAKSRLHVIWELPLQIHLSCRALLYLKYLCHWFKHVSYHYHCAGQVPVRSTK
jgi:hypothetical protein